MVSDTGLLPWYERLRAEVPDLDVFDAHTHIGANDPDGYSCSRQELVEFLGRVDASAFVFPMHEPDGYPAANDMVMAEAAASDGRLFPLCRLDPHDEPLAEARRCLAAGARGIKLHPRAEAFNLDHPDLQDVFALADERRLPILCHAGRGIPALGRHSIEVCSRHPGLRLILAHAGISDLSWIWREAPAHPNLFFDTAWWSPSDVQALFALVPPGQILMASDAPYGTPAFAATMAIRHGLQVGLSPDGVRSVLGGQARRLADGEDPLDLGPAPGSGSLSRDPLLERVYSFLLSAIGQMFAGVEPNGDARPRRARVRRRPRGRARPAVRGDHVPAAGARGLRPDRRRPPQPLRAGPPPDHRRGRAGAHPGRAAAGRTPEFPRGRLG